MCCSKAGLCTTTENVAYVSTVKPVARPSGQNPVYEEIHRSDMSIYIHITHCHRSINLCYSIPHSDALGTGTGAGENQEYEEIHRSDTST